MSAPQPPLAPLASFDDTWAFMEMLDQGMSPEELLQKHARDKIDSLEQHGSRMIQVLAKTKGDVVAASKTGMQKLAQEDIFLAARTRLPQLRESVRILTEETKTLGFAKEKAEMHLKRVQQQNSELTTELQTLKQRAQSRPPYGPHQEQYVRLGDAIKDYSTKQ